jgi:hypothetical protein
VAFTTIPASGSTPVQFVGTDGPDAIDIQNTQTFELTGLGANDSIVFSTQILNALASGGDGDDIITGNILGGGTIVQSKINGNAGADTIGNPQLGISASNSNPNVPIVNGGTAGILGGQGGDTIYVGNLQTSRVNGNLGDDIIFTSVASTAAVNTSDSEIFGGQGNDTVSVGNGTYINSFIGGNVGEDLINVGITTGTLSNTTIDGGEGNDTINGAASTANLATLIGGLGDDNITGGSGNDSMEGGDNNDTLNGGAGSDTLSGGSDDDTINGGAGIDTLTGGTGNDTFQQGAGSTGSLGLIAVTTGINVNTVPGDTINGVTLVTVTGTTGTGVTITPIGASTQFGFVNGTITDAQSNGVLDSGDTLVLNTGFDVVTDWQASDLLQTGTVNYAVGDFNNITDMTFGYAIPPAGTNFPIAPALGASYNFAFRGNWDNANSFAIGVTPQSGADILVGTIALTDINGNNVLDLADFAAGVANISNWTVLDNVAPGVAIGTANWV